MKRFKIFLIVGATLAISCTKDCEPVIATCLERPPTNEVCAAYFETGFYNKEM